MSGMSDVKNDVMHRWFLLLGIRQYCIKKMNMHLLLNQYEIEIGE